MTRMSRVVLGALIAGSVTEHRPAFLDGLRGNASARKMTAGGMSRAIIFLRL